MKTLFILLSTFFFLPIQGQGYDAKVIDYRTEISLNKGKLITRNSRKILILNRGGDRYTEISLPYSDLSKISNIKALIKDRNGKIVKKLSKSEIITKHQFSNGSFYKEHYVKEFRLRHNTYPYTFEYSYEIKEKQFYYIDYWIPVINRKVPTSSACLSILLPSDFTVHYSADNVDDFMIDSTEDGILYMWKASYTDALKPEHFAPDIKNYFPHVIVVPKEFNFEVDGSFKTWNDFGLYEHQLLLGCDDLPDLEIFWINSITQNQSLKKEKIRLLYHRMQDETRYINITIETGGLKPYPASYVADNKYGDCKALSNYFKAVLDQAGIESYYSLVYAGEKIMKIDKSLPAQQFNHVILSIPMEEDTLWLDCTSDGPFNYAGTFIQNREALIVKEEVSHFAKVPPLTLEDVLETRTISFYMNQDMNMEASVKNSFRGDNFEFLSSVARETSSRRKDEIIRDYFIESEFELIEYSLIEHGRDEKEISVEYTATTPSIYQKYGNEILIMHLKFPIPKMEAPADRNFDLNFDYPLHYIDTIDYYIPSGYQISNLPIEKEMINEFGKYSLRYTQKKGHVLVIKSLQLSSGTYSLEKYGTFYEFIKAVTGSENTPCMVITKQK